MGEKIDAVEFTGLFVGSVAAARTTHGLCPVAVTCGRPGSVRGGRAERRGEPEVIEPTAVEGIVALSYRRCPCSPAVAWC